VAIHARFRLMGQRTCIDCQNGIAHNLPEVAVEPPGWIELPKLTDAVDQVGE